METVDSYIPEPERDTDQPYLMPIEDVFTIRVVAPLLPAHRAGIIHVGDEIEIVGLRPTQKTTCTGIEMFRKSLDEGQAGDNIGVLCVERRRKKSSVVRCSASRAPSPRTPNFQAQVYVLTQAEGGRHKPFFNNYRPQFYFRTTDVTGMIQLPEGTEMVMPGDNIEMTVELGKPIAMDEGLRFAIREGGRTVGAGRVNEDHQIRNHDGKNEKRIAVTLACEQCKRRNYITMKNKINDRERIEMKKYCRWDRVHTLHKETR